MPHTKAPMAEPVVVPFDDGAVQLTSVIDPDTFVHQMTYDLCDLSVNLGKYGNVQAILEHRMSQRCRSRVNKATKDAAKKRNLVSRVTQCAIKFD